ncbi:GDYXXLXY domain-containing protein [Desertifilum sp. FACHB-1129]|uniref:GDYXXLXY domain-containing protein n=1 Tax=Desertifilum tharense IPPAS B-1220 TaxID=1781255 RepID=A0ACD5GZF3_9CYAN|nr:MULTISPECIES: GDYXXLXY domain-containing protein [Desertifilum]MBD2312538.1 GDYXXLXY domain-containing protein [Desertifilum sp. FACHB-1129]MBD2323480.1 GDYXXLXY domain-containing protein [Desertifilum sp. FACHB-866]MBD2333325.1 GDYXXLXY domain-containing protein [Desertifilum sp. FACHB-868]MDA0212894.1 GDYXXLXY domain-containing protein [Cyanobacteria bacterium FC1]
MTLPSNTDPLENSTLNPNITATRPSRKLLPSWRLWLPFVFQAALIISVPAQAVYTHLMGKTVILQTMPVDPYDLLRGYSQTLSYDISRWDTLQALPGWKELLEEPNSNESFPAPGTSFYVVLEEPETPEAANAEPLPWKPVQVSRNRPSQLNPNQVAIKGYFNYAQIKYGLETYYMPEDQRQQINHDISAAQLSEDRPFRVEVKVDERGRAVPVSLWISDRNYRF